LKDEIKGVDDEIAMLQDSLINELMLPTEKQVTRDNSPCSYNEVLTLDGPRPYSSTGIVGLSTI
jgi:hypothetical protein